MTQFLIAHFIGEACDNVRDARIRERYGVLSGVVGIACNVLLFAAKLLIGWLTGAVSVAADAFNNLSDGLSSLISIVGLRYPDVRRTHSTHLDMDERNILRG